MKKNFYLLSCLALSLTLLFSCGTKEEILPISTEISNDLSDELSKNKNFKHIIGITNAGNFSESELNTITENTALLLSEIPALVELDKESLAELIDLSIAKASDLPNYASSRFECANGAAYYSCAIAAYNDFIFTYRSCGNNASCIANANAAIDQAYALCRSWHC